MMDLEHPAKLAEEVLDYIASKDHLDPEKKLAIVARIKRYLLAISGDIKTGMEFLEDAEDLD